MVGVKQPREGDDVGATRDPAHEVYCPGRHLPVPSHDEVCGLRDVGHHLTAQLYGLPLHLRFVLDAREENERLTFGQES